MLTPLVKDIGKFVLKVAVVFAFSLIFLVTVNMGNLLFPNNWPKENFAVQGSANTNVSPDSFSLTLGRTIRNANTIRLQEQADKIISDARAALVATGLEESNIKIGSYNIYPVYSGDGNEISNYELMITMEIKVEETDLANNPTRNLINEAAKAGMGEVRGVYFYLKDYEKVQRELESEAVRDAKELATRRADESGLRLGKVVNVIYGGGQGYYPMPYSSDAAVRSEMLATPAPDDAGSSDTTSTENNFPIGETEVTQTVTVIYETL